jgi:hypothetical protein
MGALVVSCLAAPFSINISAIAELFKGIQLF